jgi:hypothetical protein
VLTPTPIHWFTTQQWVIQDVTPAFNATLFHCSHPVQGTAYFYVGDNDNNTFRIKDKKMKLHII